MNTTKLLIVSPISANDAILQERNFDWIYALNGKTSFGHCLLVAAADAHAELVTKCRISAEVAFETVEVLTCKASPAKSKSGQVNHLFKQAAAHVATNYRYPFLFLEPDCVPLKPDWRERLLSAYDAQPKKYMGAFLKTGESVFMARTGIYSTSAIHDLRDVLDSEAPFERTASISRAAKTMLIQCGSWQPEDALDKIRDDAVLFHSDKTGSLIELLREKPSQSNGHISLSDTDSASPIVPSLNIDMRTKAGRALKAQLK